MKPMMAFLAFLAGALEASAQSFPVYPDKFPSRLQIETFGQSLGVTETASALPLSPTALALIKEFEGWVPYPYNDAVGFCTIGFGHLIAKVKCEMANLGEFRVYTRENPLPAAEGAKVLETDTIAARLAVQRLVKVNVNTDQFGSLSSFVFNVGMGHFQTSTLLELLNRNVVEAAAKEFRKWRYANGVELAGLVSRRACEETLFRSRLRLGAHAQFSRSVCEAGLGVADDSDAIDVMTGNQIRR